jgi:Ran GTPase-activating protein (RanGAP) involved in mRNA processing and transport
MGTNWDQLETIFQNDGDKKMSNTFDTRPSARIRPVKIIDQKQIGFASHRRTTPEPSTTIQSPAISQRAVSTRQRSRPLTSDFNFKVVTPKEDELNRSIMSINQTRISQNTTYTPVVVSRRASMDKTFFEKISPNLQKLHDQEYIHKVHVDVLRELYEAKCVDNKHDPNEN